MQKIYVNGNTVRKLAPEPVRRERVRPVETEEEKRKKRRRQAVRRNRARSLAMSRGYVFFLSCCTLVTACVAGSYVMLQAKITRQLRNISVMESKVADLKADNDASYKRIVSSVDLNYIKKVAINKLGMDYATEDQIIYYDVEKNDYMNQYGEIPK